MRIFFLSLIVLALFTMHAAPGSSGTNVVPEGSGAFVDPSHIFENIQIRALAAPNPSSGDFWDMAKKSEQILQDYVPHLLQNATAYFKTKTFTDITSAMNDIVNTTTTFRKNIVGALNARDITPETLTEEINGIFLAIMNELEKIPSPEEAPGHAQRSEMVDDIVDHTTRALKLFADRCGIEEEVIGTYMLALKPQVQALIVAVGDINEQYPQLFPMLAFSVAALLIPESWMLRPFLSLFGFGPIGPVKGSSAAWLQSRFWGSTVQSSSWFSWLQAAGMGITPKWAGFAIKMTLWMGTTLITLVPCLCNRR